jgi:hypothetical protein
MIELFYATMLLLKMYIIMVIFVNSLMNIILPNIRIDSETKEILTYLCRHNVIFQPNLRKIIKAELSEVCIDFEMK